ncbi:MAG: hypothetical protein AB7P34_04495 [Vicinamibacterales bacterium]
MTPSKTQPALLGGVAIGVLSALPVINVANCCCAWILFGGALAAYLMQQNHPEPVGAGDGAVVGLLAGVVGAFVWLVITIPISTMMAPLQEQMMQRALGNASGMSAEARAFLENLSGPATGLGLVFSFFVMLCISSVFGLFGGLFGAMMFRKTAPPPPPPPPYFPGSTPDGFSPPPLPGEERR